jgi:hypothetical protein
MVHLPPADNYLSRDINWVGADGPVFVAEFHPICRRNPPELMPSDYDYPLALQHLSRGHTGFGGHALVFVANLLLEVFTPVLSQYRPALAFARRPLWDH